MFEHYSRKFKETRQLIYYANSIGKVGFVRKKQLRNSEMSEQLIQWIQPKTIVRNNKPILVVNVHKRKTPIKKIIAGCFIREYDSKMHYIYHDDDDYHNCSVANLRLRYQHDIHAIVASRINRKPVTIIIRDKEIDFDSIIDAARHLYVHPDTLSNYLRHKTSSICVENITIIRNNECK